MKVTFWKGVARKIRPDAKTPRGKELSQMSLGKRISRTFDRIELKGLKAGFEGKINFLGGGFKLKKIKLDVDSMVRVAKALNNSGPRQKKRFANYFVQKHFSNYFAESFPRQQVILERMIAPGTKIEAATIANAFPDTEIAINSLQVIMKETERIIKDIKAARPYSPPTREHSTGLVADLFSNALTYPLTRIDSTINELRKLKNGR